MVCMSSRVFSFYEIGSNLKIKPNNVRMIVGAGKIIDLSNNLTILPLDIT